MSDSAKPGYRPPARMVLSSPLQLIAFGGGTGLSPWAPGTAGTLVGILLWLLLSGLPVFAYAIVTLLLFLFGCWVCGRSAKLLGVHDHPGIVFDEIVAYLLAAMPLLPALQWREGAPWWWLLAAFVLFRLFDIIKPPPIRWFDRNVHGGLGIMLDDILAAIPVAVILMIVEYLLR